MAPFTDAVALDPRQMRTPASFTAAGKAILPPGVDRIVFLPPILADWLSSFLMGVLLMQVLSYQRKYGRTDPRWTRYWIYTLFALNIATFGLAFSKAIKIRALHLCDFTYFVNFHNRPDDIMLYAVVPFVIGGSQLFMIIRSFLFMRALHQGPSSSSGGGTRTNRLPRWAIACFVGKLFLCFAATTLGMMGTIITAVGYETYTPIGLINKIHFVGKRLITTTYFTYLVTSTTLDVIIALTLSYDLHRAKSGQPASTSVLATFITVVLANGFLLATTQSLALVLYFVGEVGWSDCSAVLVPRLATVTLLTSILRPREAYRALQKEQREREEEERREMEGMLGVGGGWMNASPGSGTMGTGAGGTTLGGLTMASERTGMSTVVCGSCCRRGTVLGLTETPKIGGGGATAGGGEMSEMGEWRGFEVGLGGAGIGAGAAKAEKEKEVSEIGGGLM